MWNWLALAIATYPLEGCAAPCRTAIWGDVVLTAQASAPLPTLQPAAVGAAASLVLCPESWEHESTPRTLRKRTANQSRSFCLSLLEESTTKQQCMGHSSLEVQGCPAFEWHLPGSGSPGTETAVLWHAHSACTLSLTGGPQEICLSCVF